MVTRSGRISKNSGIHAGAVLNRAFSFAHCQAEERADAAADDMRQL